MTNNGHSFFPVKSSSKIQREFDRATDTSVCRFLNEIAVFYLAVMVTKIRIGRVHHFYRGQFYILSCKQTRQSYGQLKFNVTCRYAFQNRFCNQNLFKTLFNIIGDHLLELGCNIGSTKCFDFFAFNKNRCCRHFTGAGKRDADIGMF